MFRVFLFFAYCEPNIIDCGYFELLDTSLIDNFLELLCSKHFITKDQYFREDYIYKEIADFIINICEHSSLHATYHYFDDRIEVFRV